MIESSGSDRPARYGIVVAAGSDAGNIGTLHGPGIFREISALSQAGLTPREILQAVTVNGARVLGMPGAAGRLLPGMRADVVILEADPRLSAKHLSRAYRVIKGGRVFDPAELVPDG